MFKLVFLSIVVSGLAGGSEPIKTAMPAPSLEDCTRVVEELRQRLVANSDVKLSCEVVALPPPPSQDSSGETEIAALIPRR